MYPYSGDFRTPLLTVCHGRQDSSDILTHSPLSTAGQDPFDVLSLPCPKADSSHLLVS